MHLDTHLLLDPVPPPAHRLDPEKPRNAQIPRVPADGWCACACACACENFVPSGFRLSCLSTPSVNITAGGRGGASAATVKHAYFPALILESTPQMLHLCSITVTDPPTPPHPILPNPSLIAPLCSLRPSPLYLCPIFPYLSELQVVCFAGSTITYCDQADPQEPAAALFTCVHMRVLSCLPALLLLAYCCGCCLPTLLLQTKGSFRMSRV